MKNTQQEIMDRLKEMDDELDVYDYFIAKALSVKEQPIRRPENKIKGCASGLWVEAEIRNGVIASAADSDSLIIKGIAAVICEVYNGMTLEQAEKTEITFLDGFDLAGELDESRRSGLSRMIKKIKGINGGTA